FTAILFISSAAALGRKIESIPPLQLSRRRQGRCASLLVADQIPAHRDHSAAALRPERRDDVGGARSPIETGNQRLLDLERIHEGDCIGGYGGRLSIAQRFIVEETVRAMSSKER